MTSKPRRRAPTPAAVPPTPKVAWTPAGAGGRLKKRVVRKADGRYLIYFGKA